MCLEDPALDLVSFDKAFDDGHCVIEITIYFLLCKADVVRVARVTVHVDVVLLLVVLLKLIFVGSDNVFAIEGLGEGSKDSVDGLGE